MAGISARRMLGVVVLQVVASFYTVMTAHAQEVQMARLAEGYHCSQGKDVLDVTAFATNILRVVVRPDGVRDNRTPVLDPALHEAKPEGLRVAPTGKIGSIETSAFEATFDCAANSITVSTRAGGQLLKVSDLLQNAVQQRLTIHRSDDQPLYGISGINRNATGATLERPHGGDVNAGSQGKGGGPFFFTKKFGVLVDSVDGAFAVDGNDVRFEHGSRKELEFFVMVGSPLETISSLADLTGHSPMPPRWTLGFLNSQWGIDETELKSLVAHYRASHIPLDGFIIDYDWKAWGEDDYGEWRWNSSSAPGNSHPDKFPDGASGALGKDMRKQGVYLSGIMKPRILLYKEGTTEFLQAAAYAEAHHLWYPGLGPMLDYTTNRPAANLNYLLPETRAWFWKHLEPAFDTGIAGWWNDEADQVGLADKTSPMLSSIEGLRMGQSIYEGQRAYSNTRVWTLNRNFYMGAQRYGYAEWSGDIKTGTVSMAEQPVRMLSTLNLGEPHWSMDTGGFRGVPTSEEYARWVEFAAFTPISRVHASHNQKRQPWVFGSVAEAAAKNALRLRYSLLPYIYSAERSSYKTGIGIVRPLEWIYPDDPIAAKQTDEWMFGDALLVAPVLDVSAGTRKVYLPAGQWTEFATGKTLAGGQSIEMATDTKTWSDIPLFVREGTMLATEEPGDDTDAMHPAEITVDVFPSQKNVASWTMYDDDGATYNYEKGAYFEQAISAGFRDGVFALDLQKAQGTFSTSVRSYRIRVHNIKASSLRWNETAVVSATSQGATAENKPSWIGTHDRFGDVMEIRVKTGVATHLNLTGAMIEAH